MTDHRDQQRTASEPRDGKGKESCFSVGYCSNAPFCFDDGIDCLAKRGVIHSNCYNIVRIVRYRGGKRSLFEAKPFDPSSGRGGVLVAVDDGEF